MKKYRILTLDGGGVRGVFSAVLLKKIVERVDEDFLSTIDFVAGTSTGALLALAIANEMPISTAIDLYVNDADTIFNDTWIDNIIDLGKLRGAQYKTAPLKKKLKELFGNAVLGDLKKHVLIPTFDLYSEDEDEKEEKQKDHSWKPKIFHNFEGKNSDANQKVVDVGLYATAAPTYFPSVNGYIDGGVYANNPTLCALAQTQDGRYEKTSLENVHILSLGTGKNPQHIKTKTNNWGIAQWASPLLSLMFDGTMGIADYQCKQFLQDRYYRLAPNLPQKIELDAVNKIGELVRLAEETPIDTAVEWISSHWM
ncbi:MAG: patatin-like phospholipase family protein [Anaerolineae bacterium]